MYCDEFVDSEKSVLEECWGFIFFWDQINDRRF